MEYKDKDGGRYEGQWKYGLRHGYGTMWYANGTLIKITSTIFNFYL